ncbi:MAG TPA: hypothetical protein VGO52_02470 [Hyphomonadaceae bacterium]|jgi:hypothetical protein|nr:hypothetical protein [Hyphomonadaceae bacterium]
MHHRAATTDGAFESAIAPPRHPTKEVHYGFGLMHPMGSGQAPRI